MSDYDDDDTDDTEAIYPDPFITALELCRIASSPKTIATALKRLRRIGRDIDAAEQKLAAVTAQVGKNKPSSPPARPRSMSVTARSMRAQPSLRARPGMCATSSARLTPASMRLIGS